MIKCPKIQVFEDVAQAMGIYDPSLVEKDFFTTRVLSACALVKSSLFLQVFAGGTCLCKAHKAIERMSEDIDIKLVKTETGEQLSRTALKKSLKSIRNDILEALKLVELPVPPENIKSRNEYHYTELKIPYQQRFTPSVALRPEIKLDLTLSKSLSPPIIKPVSSFVAEIFEESPEITSIPCIQIEDMAAEKLVSLTRRIAGVIRGRKNMDDETSVRHIFDLNAIEPILEKNEIFPQLVQRVVIIDIEQFGNQVPEYKKDPRKETAIALRALAEIPQYSQRYKKFVRPLVYSKNPPL